MTVVDPGLNCPSSDNSNSEETISVVLNSVVEESESINITETEPVSQEGLCVYNTHQARKGKGRAKEQTQGKKSTLERILPAELIESDP